MDASHFVWGLVFLSFRLSQTVDACPITCRCVDSFRNVTCIGLVNEFPRPLPKTTVQLTITDSSVGDINQKVFEGLKDLKKVWIRSSTIRVIHTCSLSNLQNMTSLRLENVTIQQIARNGFSHFRDIEEISITRSTINEIMEFAFHDIVKTKLFQISDSTIGKLATTAFRDLSDVDNFILSNINISEIEYAPIKSISGINRMRITDNYFNSTFCGLETVGNLSEPNTLRSLNFSGNTLACNVDIINTLKVYSGTTVSVTRRNNRCKEPAAVAGRSLEEDISATLESGAPACPPTKNLKDEHSCQMYTLDDPILPVDEVPYPTDKPENKGHCNGYRLLTLCVLLFSFMLKQFNWIN